MNKYEKTFSINGKDVKVTSGNFGFRADTAIMLQQGETVVMAFVTVDSKDSNLDYFPLGINYMEKHYASGMISGSRFVKRERRPSDDAIIKGRIIDRGMRPLFPGGFKRGVSIVINALSYDEENDPALLAANAAALAVHLSSVPFEGPVSYTRVGTDIDGNFIINPTISQLEESKMDAVISSTKDAITQLEVEGNQIAEDKMAEVFQSAYEQSQEWNKVMDEIRNEIGREKIAFEGTKANMELVEELKPQYIEKLTEALFDDENRNDRLDKIQNEVLEKYQEKIEADELKSNDIFAALDYINKSITRENLLQDKRLSGRAMNEIRELEVVDQFLPRVHGSAMFRRGITQVLSITTLGSTSLAQINEDMDGEHKKYYMHHYVGPNYSFGDAGRFSFYPGNREIGHGMLAEKAVKYVLPTLEEFPYTIRVVSEILSQNGSTSMAATCGSCLALMDAGVPIKAPVAGISIGLITEDDSQSNYKLLTDVQDVEDFFGDMDFKVCGTEKGITAIQMDTKLKGVKVNILQEALSDAKEARLTILNKYKEVLPEPRKELSKYAPLVEIVKINKDKIGELIGPQGKVIKGILESVDNKAEVDIQEDGQVVVTAIDKEVIQSVLQQIKGITMEPEVGKIYDGIVDGIIAIGAFVKISPSVSGLVHVSELSNEFVKDPNDVVKVGQKVKVKLLEIGSKGLKLSIKQAEPKKESIEK